MGRFTKQLIRVLGLSMVLVTGVVQGVIGAAAMTEAQKKEAVYRMYDEYKRDFPAVEDISVRKAMQLLSQKAVVFVDTRKPDEMDVSMLPAAVSEKHFLNHSDRYKNKIAVGYCTISYRSGVFAREMADKGITVINLRGGILAWLLEGGTVYDQEGHPTKRVHVYGDRWEYAPVGYEIVKFSLWERLFD